MQRRPLINTRDEPHADASKWRRFHVILGDSNMSPFATRLKTGATALMLSALVIDAGRQGLPPVPVLAAPLQALRTVSADIEFRETLPLEGGGRASAIEIQRRCLELVRAALGEAATGWRKALLEDWRQILDDLERDPSRCADRLDWAAKRLLLGQFQAEQGLAVDDPWLRSLDLAYSDLDAEQGLYAGLEAGGLMRGVPDEAAVERAIRHPPLSTRAAVRGRLIQRFGAKVTSAQWDHVTLAEGGREVRISLMDLFAPERIDAYLAAIDRAESVKDLENLTNL